MAHQVSKEILYHFLCDACTKWWSIGDWEPKKTLTCPHCNHKDEVVELDKDMVQNEIDQYLKECEREGKHL